MTKIKTAFLLIIAATLIVFLLLGATVNVYADVSEPPATEQKEPAEDEEKEIALVTQFTEYLKQKYGADYTYYYDRIISEWGSVEAYLVSLGENIPEEYQSAWQKFVKGLGDNAPFWAPVLAVVIVVIVTLLGKKQFNKIVERIVNGKLSPVANELNLQSKAMSANSRALRNLLGNNEKFKDTVRELEAVEKELNDE